MSFFLDIFTLGDAVFDGLSAGVKIFMGDPDFFMKNMKILQKNTKKTRFFR